MPETFLGEGLIFEEMLPLSWEAGPLPQGPILARQNADNHQLLSAESTLDEVRISDALKEESPALVHELQRLEYKLNILLRLTAELAARSLAAARGAEGSAGRARVGMVRCSGAAGGRYGIAAHLHQSGAAAAVENPQRGFRRAIA